MTRIKLNRMSASSQLQKEKKSYYSLLFADDLVFLNCCKEFGNTQAHINKYL